MVKYGDPCNRDNDCSSKLCEMTYSKNGYPDTRKCVIQQIKYGKPCDYNKDCSSNRCVKVLDENSHSKGKFCIVIDGLKIPKKRDWEVDDDTEYTDKQKAARDQEFLISNEQKRIRFEGRGPLTDIIVLFMELIIYVMKEIVRLMWNIWKRLFKVVSFLPSTLYDHGWEDFSRKYRNKDTQKCINESVTLRAKTVVKFMCILFPPLGVFLDRGIYGLGHILIASILSMLFYFPGVIYALTILDDKVCPNSIELCTRKDFKGIRHKFSYGDYNFSDGRLQEMDECNISTETKTSLTRNIPSGSAGIGSVKLGKNVEVILYSDNNFKQVIKRVSNNETDLVSKLDDSYYTDCSYADWAVSATTGPQTTKINKDNDFKKEQFHHVAVKAISIRLKKPLPILPEKVDDDKVVFYLLNDFRGKNLILEKGDYDYDEIGNLFADRISSIRIGKNMKVILFEDKHYNRKSLYSFSTPDMLNPFGKNVDSQTLTAWVSSGGSEKEFLGNEKHDTLKMGEVANLAGHGFNDKISSMIICNITGPCSKNTDGEDEDKLGVVKFGEGL